KERMELETGVESERAALTASATIEKAKGFHALLASDGMFAQLLTDFENRNSKGEEVPEDGIIDVVGHAHQRTCATLIASRGADIIPDSRCAKAGGLDVIITDIPATYRVERQVRGRAGRQGKPGTSVIVANCEDDNFMAKLSESVRGSI